jgi:hypothetical protein
METAEPKQGWSMNMVAIVLSTIVTFVFWSLAVGNYRSEQRALQKAQAADPEVATPQPTPVHEDRPKVTVVGVVGGILILIAALIIFIWCWRNGVFIHPGTVLFITVYVLISAVIVCACGLEAVMALPEFFVIAPYTVRTSPVSFLIFSGVIAAIWAGAIAMQRLEDHLFPSPKSR